MNDSFLDKLLNSANVLVPALFGKSPPAQSPTTGNTVATAAEKQPTPVWLWPVVILGGVAVLALVLRR